MWPKHKDRELFASTGDSKKQLVAQLESAVSPNDVGFS